jgi:hypothetical protein
MAIIAQETRKTSERPTRCGSERPTDLYSIGELAALTGLPSRKVRSALWKARLEHHRLVGERAYSLAESLPWLALASAHGDPE